MLTRYVGSNKYVMDYVLLCPELCFIMSRIMFYYVPNYVPEFGRILNQARWFNNYVPNYVLLCPELCFIMSRIMFYYVLLCFIMFYYVLLCFIMFFGRIRPFLRTQGLTDRF